MKRELFNLYNNLKQIFVNHIGDEIEAKGGKIKFEPYVRIDFPSSSDDFFEDILSIEYDEKEKCYYVHNFVTGTDLAASDYWTPLRDMNFNELYKIAERL